MDQEDEDRMPTAEIDVASLEEQAGRLGVRGAASVVLSGANVGREIRLEATELMIGRDGSRDVCLPDEGVSREYARLLLAAAEVQRRIRAKDILARCGGEEFCLPARAITADWALALACDG